MLEMRLSLKSDSAPELVDLDAMLASVQRQIQEEIDSNDFVDPNASSRVVLQNQTNPSRTGEGTRMKLTVGDGTETTRFDASQMQGNSPSRQLLREEHDTEFRNRTMNSRPVSSLSARHADESGIAGYMTGSTRSLNQIQEQRVAEHDDVQGNLGNLSRSSAALPISGNFLHHVQNKLDGDDRAACWTLPRNKKFEDGSHKQSKVEVEKAKSEVQSASGQRKSMDSVPEAWKNYWSCEQSISSARASVMVYDDSLKKWVPSGSSSGLSKVHIYHHTQHNTFRVVGRKLHDHEVVINCGIVRGLKYNQATATFHQWRDSRQVYGLNFSCREDADCFARAMMHSLEVLANRTAGAPAPPAPPPAVNGHHPPATHYDEDMGYRTMTREDAAIIQQQHHNQQQQQNLQQQLQQQIQQQALQQQALQQQALQQQALQQQALQQQQQLHSQMTAVSLQQQQNQQQTQQAQPVAVVGAVQTPPQPPPHGPGLNHSLPLQQPATHNSHTHHRTSSAPMSAAMSLPPAPPPVPPHQNLGAHSSAPAPPPPTPPAAPPMSLQCGAPPPPPPPGVTSAGPPPPPPPPMAASSPAGAPATSLAAQLQHARLKKAAPSSNKQPLPQENSGSSTSSGGSAGKATTPTPAPPTPMHSMMNEMARTLARRRAQVDRSEEGGQEPLKTWEKSATLPHRLGGAAASNGNGSSSGSLAAGNSSNGGAPAPPPPPNCSDADNKARRRMASASEETILKQINGEGVCVGPGDWEAFKQEVLREVRAQVSAIKQEIIDAVKMELARR